MLLLLPYCAALLRSLRQTLRPRPGTHPWRCAGTLERATDLRWSTDPIPAPSSPPLPPSPPLRRLPSGQSRPRTRLLPLQAQCGPQRTDHGAGVSSGWTTTVDASSTIDWKGSWRWKGAAGTLR